MQAPDSISVEICRGGTTGQADLPPDTRSAACLRKVEGWTRVDAVWLAVQPLDMRLGTEAALARVVVICLQTRFAVEVNPPMADVRGTSSRVGRQNPFMR